jgi:hypothetical protein
MNPLLQELLSLLKLNPSTSVIEAMIMVFNYCQSALDLKQFQVVVPGNPSGSNPQPLPAGATVHACCGGYLEAAWPLEDPWIGINGDLTISGQKYDFQCRRYATDSKDCHSIATINGNVIPGGLVLHLDKVGVGPGLGAELTIAYIFHAAPPSSGNPGSPEIWLMSTIDVSLLSSQASGADSGSKSH